MIRTLGPWEVPLHSALCRSASKLHLILRDCGWLVFHIRRGAALAEALLEALWKLPRLQELEIEWCWSQSEFTRAYWAEGGQSRCRDLPRAELREALQTSRFAPCWDAHVSSRCMTLRRVPGAKPLPPPASERRWQA